MKHLRIGHLSTAYHTAFILMGSKWIEKRMKIEAAWRLFPTGPEMVRTFFKGELDVGYIGLPPAMTGIERGLDAKCVGGGHVEGTVVIAGKEFRTFEKLKSVKKTLSQFRGKTIGTPTRGSIHDVIIRKLIQEAGLQKDVSVRNFEWADFIIEAMEEKIVQGGCGTPSLAVLASRYLNAGIVIPPNAVWSCSPSYGIVATSKMIEESPDTLQSFLSLHEDACNLIRKQPIEAAEVAAKAIGIVGKDFMLDVFRVSPKYCASLPNEYIDSALAFVPVLQSMGYVSKPISRADVFWTDIITKLHTEKPHYGDPAALR